MSKGVRNFATSSIKAASSKAVHKNGRTSMTKHVHRSSKRKNNKNKRTHSISNLAKKEKRSQEMKATFNNSALKIHIEREETGKKFYEHIKIVERLKKERKIANFNSKMSYIAYKNKQRQEREVMEKNYYSIRKFQEEVEEVAEYFKSARLAFFPQNEVSSKRKGWRRRVPNLFEVVYDRLCLKGLNAKLIFQSVMELNDSNYAKLKDVVDDEVEPVLGLGHGYSSDSSGDGPTVWPSPLKSIQNLNQSYALFGHGFSSDNSGDGPNYTHNSEFELMDFIEKRMNRFRGLSSPTKLDPHGGFACQSCGEISYHHLFVILLQEVDQTRYDTVLCTDCSILAFHSKHHKLIAAYEFSKSRKDRYGFPLPEHYDIKENNRDALRSRCENKKMLIDLCKLYSNDYAVFKELKDKAYAQYVTRKKSLTPTKSWREKFHLPKRQKPEGLPGLSRSSTAESNDELTEEPLKNDVITTHEMTLIPHPKTPNAMIAIYGPAESKKYTPIRGNENLYQFGKRTNFHSRNVKDAIIARIRNNPNTCFICGGLHSHDLFILVFEDSINSGNSLQLRQRFSMAISEKVKTCEFHYNSLSYAHSDSFALLPGFYMNSPDSVKERFKERSDFLIKIIHEDNSRCLCLNEFSIHHSKSSGLCNSGTEVREWFSDYLKNRLNHIQTDSGSNDIQICQFCEELNGSQEVFVAINNSVKKIVICSECFFGGSLDEFGLRFQTSFKAAEDDLWIGVKFNYCENCRAKYATDEGSRSVKGFCEDHQVDDLYADSSPALAVIGQADEEDAGDAASEIDESCDSQYERDAAEPDLTVAEAFHVTDQGSLHTRTENQDSEDGNQYEEYEDSRQASDQESSINEQYEEDDAMSYGASSHGTDPMAALEEQERIGKPYNDEYMNQWHADREKEKRDKGGLENTLDEIPEVFDFLENIEIYEKFLAGKIKWKKPIHYPVTVDDSSECVKTLFRKVLKVASRRDLKYIKDELCAHVFDYAFVKVDTSNPQNPSNHISWDSFEGGIKMRLIDVITTYEYETEFFSSQGTGALETLQNHLDFTDFAVISRRVSRFFSKENFTSVSGGFIADTSSYSWKLSFESIKKLVGDSPIHSLDWEIYFKLANLWVLLENDNKLIIGHHWLSSSLPSKDLDERSIELIGDFVRLLEVLVKTIDSLDSDRLLTELLEDYDEISLISKNSKQKEQFDLCEFLDNPFGSNERIQDVIQDLILSSDRTMSLCGKISSNNGAAVLDTNIIKYLIQFKSPVFLPFIVIFIQPVVSELHRIFKSDPNPNLSMLSLLNFMRVNEFVFFPSQWKGDIGDPIIRKFVVDVDISLQRVLTFDRNAARDHRFSLITKDTIDSIARITSEFTPAVSSSWKERFGYNRIIHVTEGLFCSGIITADNDFWLKPISDIRGRPIPQMHPNLIYVAPDYEFVPFPRSYSDLITDVELNLGRKLELYEKTEIDAINDPSNFKFIETRGPDMRAYVNSLNAEDIIKEEIEIVKSKFEVSEKLRDKTKYKKPETVEMARKCADSCFPDDLKFVDLQHRDELTFFSSHVPGISQKKNFKQLSDPEQNKRLQEKNRKTFKNNSEVKMENFENAGRNRKVEVEQDPDLFSAFSWVKVKPTLIGDSDLMNAIKEEFVSESLYESTLLKNYCYMFDHLIHDLINVRVQSGHIFVNSNNFVNFGYIIGPGTKNRKAASKRGVRFYFYCPNKSYRGFFPEFTYPMIGQSGFLLISRFYYMGAEDVLWRSKLYINLTLPRYKCTDPKQLSLLFWSLFFPTSNVKKLLSFFKYFNVISLSTFSKLPGLIKKYLNILPKRQSEYQLLNYIIDLIKEVILFNQPLTLIGMMENLSDYLEANNLYTLPRPNTTSTVHDYQMMYRDIKNNMDVKAISCEPKEFSDVWSPLKHLNVPKLFDSVRLFTERSMETTENEILTELAKGFEDFFITNTNGVNPFTGKKQKNSLIFLDVLRLFKEENPNVNQTDFHFKFIEWCLTKNEDRKSWAFISIKAQKDAADREIVIQEFFTKAAHYPLQSVFRTINKKWEAELVTKSAFEKYDYISKMSFTKNSVFINDDMKKWSPHDIKKKFILLVEILERSAYLTPNVTNLLCRSYASTEKITLLFDERLRDPSLKWFEFNELIGKDWSEFDNLLGRNIRNYQERNVKGFKKPLYTPLRFTFGWPQGILHFISSFYHGIGSIHTEKILKKVLGPETKVQIGFHSDDKNMAVTRKKEFSKKEIEQILICSSASITGDSLAQSDTKSSVTVTTTPMNFSKGESRRVSELVSVYNIEGTIADSYTRQASNLTNSMTHNNFIDNHQAIITRCCSIFNLSNQVFISELIYSQIMGYLKRFYGDLGKGLTLSYGGLKSVPIFMLARYGSSSDNIAKMIEDPRRASAELIDISVVKSSRSLSKKGIEFRDLAKAEIQRLETDPSPIKKLLIRELERLSTPLAGAFIHQRDENLNNLFLNKNEKIYTTWSKAKTAFSSDTKKNEVHFERLSSFSELVKDNNDEITFSEFVVPNMFTLKEILKVLLNHDRCLKNQIINQSGTLIRAPLSNSLELRNDFQKAQMAIRRGQSGSRDLDLMFTWNSLVEDIENFCRMMNIASVEDFERANSIWDRIRRASVERNPIFLMYKTETSFADCLFLQKEDLTYKPETHEIRDPRDGSMRPFFPFAKQFLKARQSQSTAIKEYSDRVTESINNILLTNMENFINSGYEFRISREHQLIADLVNKYSEIASSIQPKSGLDRAFLSWISGKSVKLPPFAFELVGIDHEEDAYIWSVNQTRWRVVELSEDVFVDPLADNNIIKYVIRRFPGKKVRQSERFRNDLVTKWAQYQSVDGAVKRMSLISLGRGKVSLRMTLTTKSLSSKIVEIPVSVRLTKLSKAINEKSFEKLSNVTISSTGVKVGESQGLAPPSIEKSIWGSYSKHLSNSNLQAWARFLGPLWNELDVKFCNYLKAPESTINHSECSKNSGAVIICSESRKLNKFGLARIGVLEKDKLRKLNSSIGVGQDPVVNKARIINGIQNVASLRSVGKSSCFSRFLNRRYGRPTFESRNWIRNLLDGNGFLFADKDFSFIAGYSYDVIDAVLDNRQLRNNLDDLEMIVFPTNIDIVRIKSNFSYSCIVKPDLLQVIEDNPFLIEDGYLKVFDNDEHIVDMGDHSDMAPEEIKRTEEEAIEKFYKGHWTLDQEDMDEISKLHKELDETQSGLKKMQIDQKIKDIIKYRLWNSYGYSLISGYTTMKLDFALPEEVLFVWYKKYNRLVIKESRDSIWNDTLGLPVDRPIALRKERKKVLTFAELRKQINQADVDELLAIYDSETTKNIKQLPGEIEEKVTRLIKNIKLSGEEVEKISDAKKTAMKRLGLNKDELKIFVKKIRSDLEFLSGLDRDCQFKIYLDSSNIPWDIKAKPLEDELMSQGLTPEEITRLDSILKSSFGSIDIESEKVVKSMAMIRDNVGLKELNELCADYLESQKGVMEEAGLESTLADARTSLKLLPSGYRSASDIRMLDNGATLELFVDHSNSRMCVMMVKAYLLLANNYENLSNEGKKLANSLRIGIRNSNKIMLNAELRLRLEGGTEKQKMKKRVKEFWESSPDLNFIFRADLLAALEKILQLASKTYDEILN
uniref:RNA-directed RNA polymerase L n=1 Tax=Rhizoctonia cerealis bunyavirus TaxID=3068840 RepID=A0AA51GJU9_9VIRU|nr:MAG: RNA-dependent RNA polymerase [Rhizoctonia cerealis bunyavirus]